jgi:uncharacterized protein DUF2442
MASSRTTSKKPSLKDNTIRMTEIVPLANFVMAIRFNDGASGTVDFKPFIKRGAIFAPLAKPAFFAKAEIAEAGYSIAWPGELDFSVGPLYESAMKSRNARMAS